jgi:hypothetical protein
VAVKTPLNQQELWFRAALENERAQLAGALRLEDGTFVRESDRTFYGIIGRAERPVSIGSVVGQGAVEPVVPTCVGRCCDRSSSLRRSSKVGDDHQTRNLTVGQGIENTVAVLRALDDAGVVQRPHMP